MFNIRAFVWAAAWLSVILYLICIFLWGYVFPGLIDFDVHQKTLMNLFPGFTWLTIGSFIWGLILSFVYGAIASWIFASFYNYFYSAKPARKRR